MSAALPIEGMGTARVADRDLRSLSLFGEVHRPRLSVVVCNEPAECLIGSVRILQWRRFFEELWGGRILGG